MRKTKGITLVALIITIIIMLILIAVTVSLIINSNLLGRAKNAADETKTAYGDEEHYGERANITIDGVTYNSIEEFESSVLRETVKTALDLREGDIVRYNSSIGNIDCIVLYDSTEEDFENLGVQIVTLDTVGDEIEIGNGTGNTTLTSDSDLYTIAEESYISALEMLNEQAVSYIRNGENDVAQDARCIGSKPTDKSYIAGSQYINLENPGRG